MLRRGGAPATGANRSRRPGLLLLPVCVAAALTVGTLTIGATAAASPHHPGSGRPAPLWRDAVRRIEELGFSTVSVSDHFTNGWAMEPTVAMAVAAQATQRLRVLALVLGNDFRHPVLVHKAMATPDVLSEGRVEVGLGAGWLRSDYEAAQLPYAAPAVRVERLEESVQVLKGLFTPAGFQLPRQPLRGHPAGRAAPAGAAAQPAAAGGRWAPAGAVGGRPPRRHRQHQSGAWGGCGRAGAAGGHDRRAGGAQGRLGA